ncbi:hypothetical protein CDL12_18267 [Handroanthus impetiginosus]|uniref:Major facilitator superfamily (MFS) profile domain-containing protein n=1 Tax=Handroanthus impetiginosus TaxID=429701 RepID=A0A2G9GVW7_9LAMI|nr:hypothetical protein CDL12_18267 [Handroanthus impetiginosus]
MSIAIPFFQHVTGISIVSFYAPLLFLTVGSGVSASFMSPVVLGIAGMSTNLLSLFIVDKVGRKTLFHIGKLGDYGGLSTGCSILVLILMCVCIAGFAISWGPFSWLVTSENFPQETTSATQSINVAVSSLLSFAGVQIFLTMLCDLKSEIFFFYVRWVALMTDFVYVLLPQTKDVPLEKMDEIRREHVFWKTFVGDVQEEEARE